MNRRTGFLQVLLLVIVSLMFYGSLAQASLAEDVPETKILATIDEVTITQEEFNREISSLHRTMLEEGTDSVTAGRIDFPGVLHRLINLRLLALEARQIGLSEQPDFKRKMEKYREQQLKQKVLGNVVAENPITTDDEKVQTLYHRLSRELKIYDLLFDNEADAKEAATDIAKRGFVKVAEELKGTEHVQVSMDGGFLPLKELRGEVGRNVIDMELDDVSPIFTTAGGYMIFQLLEIRQVDDEGVLAEAFYIESQRHNVKVKTEFLESLVEQYAQIDEQLLAAIDFSSSGPELAVLMADNRTLATLRVPGQPVALFSVADLTEAMSDKYYHGLEQARETKTLNDAKESVLHKRLMTQLLLAEAQRLELLDSA
ncbi:MAG: peptidyl-prolyl cis-trans isomerase, partial [Desulfuromusa sp.]|nr:peptidyl-prolyl cis-trans isomerase [Desulfuromusa sp.]